MSDYLASMVSGISKIARRFERCVFTGESPLLALPWLPEPGGSCPFCHGRGHDDSGPGAWSCDECERTGTLPADWRTPAFEHRRPPGRHVIARWVVPIVGDPNWRGAGTICAYAADEAPRLHDVACACCGFPISWHRGGKWGTTEPEQSFDVEPEDEEDPPA